MRIGKVLYQTIFQCLKWQTINKLSAVIIIGVALKIIQEIKTAFAVNMTKMH